MSVVQWASFAVVMIASLYVYWRLAPLARVFSDEHTGPRTRRLLLRRVVLALGLWQWSLSLFLLSWESLVLSVVLLVVGASLVWASRNLWALGMVN